MKEKQILNSKRIEDDVKKIIKSYNILTTYDKNIFDGFIDNNNFFIFLEEDKSKGLIMKIELISIKNIDIQKKIKKRFKNILGTIFRIGDFDYFNEYKVNVNILAKVFYLLNGKKYSSMPFDENDNIVGKEAKIEELDKVYGVELNMSYNEELKITFLEVERDDGQHLTT